MKGRRTVSGGWLVFFGALFWSLNAPLVKFIEMDPLLETGLRSLIAGVVLCPFIRIKKLNLSAWTVIYIISYISLCIGVIVALSNTSAAISIGMQYGAMIWIFIGNSIINKSISKSKLVPVLMIFSGVVLFMLSGISDGTMFGNLVALTESVSFAIMTISSKKTAGENPIGLTAIANLATGLFVFCCLSPSFSDLAYLNQTEWSVMLILGVIQVGLGYAFYNMGVQKTTAQTASIISLWEMILGPIWVALFLKEYPKGLVIAGFVIILAGMAVNGFLESRETKKTCLKNQKKTQFLKK